MNQEAIFIVGSNGQLGRALRTQYPKARYADIDELDITNRASVMDFDWNAIDIIINAAAYTNVDGAETPEGRVAAWAVNAKAVQHLACIAQKHNSTLVHISTDYVFDGSSSTHTEEEAFSPLSVYGASKAAGDIAAALVSKHYILRTSWVIGEGKNFVRTMLDLGKKGVSPTVVADQTGRPTFTSELVRAIDHLLTNSASPGTYNLSNDGEVVSWSQLTRKIFEIAGYDQLTVADTTTQEYFASKDGVAPRPLQGALDLTKIQATGFRCQNWEDDLRTYIEGEQTK
jgi:dTDP-4-dehydrorhamnose 3,5-epimerase